MEAVTISDASYKLRDAKDCWQPPETEREAKKDVFLETSEGLWP